MRFRQQFRQRARICLGPQYFVAALAMGGATVDENEGMREKTDIPNKVTELDQC